MRKLFTLLSILFVSITPLSLLAQSWQNVGAKDFSTGQAAYPAIAVTSTGTPYVLFSDGDQGREATVMKFDGTNWGVAGAAGISSAQAGGFSIVTDNSGTPFICYTFTNFDSVAVKKFNGTNWVNIGPAGFAAMNARVAIDGAGALYLVYNDLTAANKASVKKYNGTTWASVGTPGLSDSTTGSPVIAFDASNTPYVAYTDNGDSGKVTVKKFNGSSWVNLGSRGVSPGSANNVLIAATGAGTVYIAFGDAPHASKATAMKYSGSGWAMAGAADFANGPPASLAIDGNGSAYLAYSLGSTASITVTKFDGTSWNLVGAANFSPEISTGIFGFTLDAAGTPYVAFADLFSSQQAVVMKYGTSTGVENLMADENLSVYPNPAHGQFTIATTTEGDYLLVNTLGQRVETFHCKANSKNTFATNNIATGLYYIINNEKHTANKIVIVQ